MGSAFVLSTGTEAMPYKRPRYESKVRPQSESMTAGLPMRFTGLGMAKPSLRFKLIDDWSVDNPMSTKVEGVVGRLLSTNFSAVLPTAQQERVAQEIRPTHLYWFRL